MNVYVVSSVLLNNLLLFSFHFFWDFAFSSKKKKEKKNGDNMLMIKSYIWSVAYLLITWNLLEDI